MPVGYPGEHVPITRVVKALGREKLWVVNPFKYKESLAATKEALGAEGVRVLISQAPCILYQPASPARSGTARFKVSRGCGECRDCLDNFGCPAMDPGRGRAGQLQEIDPDLCSGCAFCVQWCVEHLAGGGGMRRKSMDFGGEGQGTLTKKSLSPPPNPPSPTRRRGGTGVPPVRERCEGGQ